MEGGENVARHTQGHEKASVRVRSCKGLPGGTFGGDKSFFGVITKKSPLIGVWFKGWGGAPLRRKLPISEKGDVCRVSSFPGKVAYFPGPFDCIGSLAVRKSRDLVSYCGGEPAFSLGG